MPKLYTEKGTETSSPADATHSCRDSKAVVRIQHFPPYGSTPAWSPSLNQGRARQCRRTIVHGSVGHDSHYYLKIYSLRDPKRSKRAWATARLAVWAQTQVQHVSAAGLSRSVWPGTSARTGWQSRFPSMWLITSILFGSKAAFIR
jgi:hypothetical protein